MFYRFSGVFVAIFFFIGCSYKQPIYTKSATIVFKTPTIKYNDKCFIERYDDNVRLTILDLGVVIADMKIYQDKVCKNFLMCFDADRFNEKFLDKSYEKDFLYNLFIREDIYFKDREHGVLIKVMYDEEEAQESKK